ncbi:MAG: tungstate ABC transporter substrate-binding protein WtpA [Dehalococcoidales bacterium]|nr:tungstate ABC transporter substrate-binding protein WtpA [Dehalococcoidales bacterium]
MKKRFSVVVLCLAASLALSLAVGCTRQPADEPELSGTLHVFHAGSLAAPFDEITQGFNELYPDVEVLAEGAGSATTIRKVTELGKDCGVIGSADYLLIPQLMFPDYADWYIIFATNQMCIAYNDGSQYADEIDGDNWYEILQREGVTYGRSDPDQDPCGYRTLMVWQLAEEHYDVPGLYDALYQAEGDLMRPKSVDLIALLESGDLDYAFEYTSVAAEQGLEYVELPSEINLSDETYSEFYDTAVVEIAGTEPGTTIEQRGTAIVYGVTIPTGSPEYDLGLAWIDYLLSDAGVAVMEAYGQPAVVPAQTNDAGKVPELLRIYLD